MKDFKHFGVKRRYFPDHNYNAIWANLKTIRLGEGHALELPSGESEFYDVSLGTKCTTGKCKFCLIEKTEINKVDGKDTIENIKIGDNVYTYNHEKHCEEIDTVTQLFKHDYKGELIVIELENNQIIKCTPNHHIYTINRGYIRADELCESDEIYIKNS